MLVIGILCCIVFLTEGSVLDWSAVFLSQIAGSIRRGRPSVRGLLGDDDGGTARGRRDRRPARALARRRARRALRRRRSRASVLVPAWEAALAGYALIGAGCANIVPVLFTAAGRQDAMPASVAVPAVTTLGYAGVLAGPALIGFIAQATSLPFAFLMVAVCSWAWRRPGG